MSAIDSKATIFGEKTIKEYRHINIYWKLKRHVTPSSIGDHGRIVRILFLQLEN